MNISLETAIKRLSGKKYAEELRKLNYISAKKDESNNVVLICKTRPNLVPNEKLNDEWLGDDWDLVEVKHYEGSCEGCKRLKRVLNHWEYKLIGNSLDMSEDKFPWAMCDTGRIEINK